MATFDLTAGDDFVHAAGDGRIAPDGYNDVPLATNNADMVTMVGDGADQLFLGSGDDTVNAGAYFGAGDMIDGGANVDTLVLDGDYSAGLTLTAANFKSIEYVNLAAGHSYNLTFGNLAYLSNITVDGTLADSLTLNARWAGAEWFSAKGSGGNDHVQLGASSTTFYAGAGDDYVSVATRLWGVAHLYGELGNDTLFMDGPGDAFFIGGDGDDLLACSGSAVYIIGGEGNDTLAMRGGTLQQWNVIKAGNGADTLSITGAVEVRGMRPVDWEFESLFFAPGGVLRDRGSYSLIDLSGLAVADGSAGAFVFGYAYNDTLIGNGAADTFYGGEDHDSLVGGGGADHLLGEADNDTLWGGTGNDVLEGNPGIDLLYGGADNDILMGGHGNDTGYGDSGADILWGGTGNDSLVGGTLNDTLYGEQGNDTLYGEGGVDWLYGGTGADLYIDPSVDTVVEFAGGGIDTIQSSTNLSIGARVHVENIVLTGAGDIYGTGNRTSNAITGNSGNNILTGNSGYDTLTGGGGDDSLSGGNHADLLIGGEGNDYLDGGSFADIFAFATSNSGNDWVMAFQTVDRFDLSGGQFTAVSDGVNGATLSHAGGTIIVQGVTGLSVTDWNGYVV